MHISSRTLLRFYLLTVWRPVFVCFLHSVIFEKSNFTNVLSNLIQLLRESSIRWFDCVDAKRLRLLIGIGKRVWSFVTCIKQSSQTNTKPAEWKLFTLYQVFFRWISQMKRCLSFIFPNQAHSSKTLINDVAFWQVSMLTFCWDDRWDGIAAEQRRKREIFQSVFCSGIDIVVGDEW